MSEIEREGDGVMLKEANGRVFWLGTVRPDGALFRVVSVWDTRLKPRVTSEAAGLAYLLDAAHRHYTTEAALHADLLARFETARKGLPE